jgi:hypothetical protein
MWRSEYTVNIHQFPSHRYHGNFELRTAAPSHHEVRNEWKFQDADGRSSFRVRNKGSQISSRLYKRRTRSVDSRETVTSDLPSLDVSVVSCPGPILVPWWGIPRPSSLKMSCQLSWIDGRFIARLLQYCFQKLQRISSVVTSSRRRQTRDFHYEHQQPL